MAVMPDRLASRTEFVPPQKALILKPCCLSDVLMATPLLTVLGDAFPKATFDWAVHQEARQAIVGNPRIDALIDTEAVGAAGWSQEHVESLIEKIKKPGYDTCFIPSQSGLLSYIAWKAGIPQRIGLRAGALGLAHTIPVKANGRHKHKVSKYLSLAAALGINDKAPVAFYPSDSARSSLMGTLIDDAGWQGIMPLVVLNPGGTDRPDKVEKSKWWPAERFALIGGRLARKYGAKVIVVGSVEESRLVESVIGLMPVPALNLAGRLTLAEHGALCELADLYVGNESGTTHVAAAVGCPTLAIFTDGDPEVDGPYAAKGRVVVLQPELGGDGTDSGLTDDVESATAAAEVLLGHRTEPQLEL